MTKNKRTMEELKKELDELNAEQHEDFTNAIYLGMAPEKVNRMHRRGVRIRAIYEELCGFTQNDN
jgi:hypothetical protein